ncbi:YoaK family protein [Aspergillus brunneoviolaceus CBS 621.78]|uniref:Uncharacterized protein n=1 Tax=Aspergillus brunneoviolaceus CBS 621.78 TaxID=1450534 RepID=A0ACD1FZI6_9EURO|nr:hypothetical protein BO95DRAFT_238233 [Aspergillus brunneoviolaceus CBS 621.78]RAH42348.1 hypothetical protein BO95DRAFT_238233 [Aspergillus brunneoviolaceus CBS 621.78]
MHQSPAGDIQPAPAAVTAYSRHLQFSEDRGGLWSSGNSTIVSLAQSNDDGETTFYGRLARHLQSEIDIAYADIPLIVCGFVSGLVDGLSFNAWGSFSSMQTGNTVFIALGASGQPRYPAYLWAKSLIALCTFIASNIIFIQASRLLGPPRRRSSLILSFAVQSICLLVAALLVELRIVSPRPEDPRAPIQWMQIIPISLLAFQAGGQVCASRILEFDEIPTVVLTSLLCDLLVDPNLLARKNPKRDRRVGAFLALFLGAMTAGGLSKVASLASSLWFAFGLKVMITGAWTVWKTEGSGRVGKGRGSIV